MANASDRRRLSRAPISLALCQVRFSTIRDMATYVPKVQSLLRKDGYRLDMSGQVQELLLGPQGPVARPFERWEFLNVERTRSVVITEQFATFMTTAYPTFEEFLPEVTRMMDALESAGADLLITRVGLRYINAIVPSGGKTWRDYINPSLHGISVPSIKKSLAAYHAFGETSSGRVLARMTQNIEGMLVPIEMGQQNLIVQRQPAAAGTLITLLDIDHFKEWTAGFTGYQKESLTDLAWALKGDLYDVFRSFVTESALGEWR